MFDFVLVNPERFSPSQGAQQTSGAGLLARLYCMWLLTRWPAARADISDSSPASTAPATIMAKHWAFCPGDSVLGPFTPRRSKHADCAAKCVPPPTVPT